MDAILPARTRHDGLSEADIRLLGGADHSPFTVDKGSDIRCASPALHLLTEGWAFRYKLLSNGRRQIVGLHLPGEICDLDKLMFPELNIGVEAASQCRVVQIPVGWLRSAMEATPALKDLLWTLTVLENIATNELVISLGRRPARERLAWFFCELSDRLRTRGMAAEGSFQLELTQSDLGDLLGLSVVHVNRNMQMLKAEGLLASNGSAYRILDAARLRAAAHYEPEVVTWHQHGQPVLVEA